MSKIKRATQYAVNLAKGMYKMPRMAFNRKLFERIVQESLKNNASEGELDENTKAPDVRFTNGPIDRVFGSYNTRTKKIKIDILESYIKTLSHLPRNEEEMKIIFDRYLTKVLQHEAGHWELDMKKGRKAQFDKYAIRIPLFLFGLVPIYFFAKWLIPGCWDQIINFYAHGLITGFVFGTVAGLFGLGLLVAGILLDAFVSFVIAASFTYKLSWHERYAKEYVEKSKQDKRWDDVIVPK